MAHDHSLSRTTKLSHASPGPGNQIRRYDSSLVDFIYAVDPNPRYEDAIAAKLKKADLQDKYKLLVCGVEDIEILRREGITEGTIQVLCAVGGVKSVMREVWKLLRPGGSFVFWEHERNKDTVTVWLWRKVCIGYHIKGVLWKLCGGANMRIACWNPAWSALVGCCMNRDIKADILAAGEWENPGNIEVADDPYTCLPRIWGVLKKKA
jgi:hypothetical protein